MSLAHPNVVDKKMHKDRRQNLSLQGGKSRIPFRDALAATGKNGETWKGGGTAPFYEGRGCVTKHEAMFITNGPTMAHATHAFLEHRGMNEVHARPTRMTADRA